MIDGQLWFRPSIIIAGPDLGPDLAEPWTHQLKSLLNFQHVGSTVGDASGLKMWFGAVTKGHAAVFIQAYTIAHRMGVLKPPREHLAKYFPSVKTIHESSMVGSQRKAYRWIEETEEIELTFQNHDGWAPDLFAGVGDVSGPCRRQILRRTTEELSRTLLIQFVNPF
ncbi:hypothetical protein G7054_g1350 [Neopestalotiopsis clavispora]|nr:hypothetical protein G7054_g1350 [Neopestalotiopsis clavispora]